MSNKLNNIFSETTCLSSDILAEYAGGMLGSEDRYLVEKHLADCELCSDALEGLSLIKNKSKLHKIYSSINSLIDAKTQNKAGKVLHFDFRVKLAVAAIFISVIGITVLFKYLLNEQKSDKLALRKEKETQKQVLQEESKENELAADSVITQEQHLQKAISGDNEQSKTLDDLEYKKKETGEKDIPLFTINSTLSANGMAAAEQKVVTGYSWSPQKDEDLNKIENTESKATEELINDFKTPAFARYKSEPDRNLIADSLSVSNEIMQTKNIAVLDKSSKESCGKNLKENQKKAKLNKKAESKFDGEVTTISTTSPVVASGGTNKLVDQRYATAINKYDSLDYWGCSKVLESYLVTYPDDYNALYYCAASNYFLNQYEKAIVYFKKVVKKKNGTFYDTSQWYLALSYIGNNDNSNAEKILNEIIASGGSFKTQAEAKLIEIKK